MSAPSPLEFPIPVVPDHVLVKCIGKGSYGTVWLAKNLMGVFRAVKVIYRQAFENGKPYEREFSGIKKFEPISRSHEGLIDVLHVGINDKEDYFYYVMELGDDEASGQVIDPVLYSPNTLAKEIGRKGILPAHSCIGLGIALSQALAYLHDLELVHRDVKPSNIVFIDGVPKLADIGLVAAAMGGQSLVGTSGYIPPEGPGLPPADIFSLGKVLYECCTGKDRLEFPQLPGNFEGFPDSRLFLELNEILLKACHNDVAKRYPSASELYDELLLLSAGKSVKRLRVLEQRFQYFKRAAVIATAAVLLIGGFLYLIYQKHNLIEQEKSREEGADVANAVQAENEGDLLQSVQYFTKAVESSPKNKNYQAQLTAALAQCPKLSLMISENRQVIACEWSRDGTKVLATCDSGPANVFDVESARKLGTDLPVNPDTKAAGWNGDTSQVITASFSRVAEVWRVSDQTSLFRLEHPGGVPSAKFANDPNIVITGCQDGNARLWNLKTLKPTIIFPHGGSVRFAALSQDDKLAVTCGTDSTAQVWDAITGDRIGPRLHHRGWVTCAKFSADGTRLITGSSDRTAKVWEVSTGRQISIDLCHKDTLCAVDLSPDQQQLMTASYDGEIRFWHADTFRPDERLSRLSQPQKVTSASYSPNGRQIAVASTDGTIRVWDLAGQKVPRSIPGNLIKLQNCMVKHTIGEQVEVSETRGKIRSLIRVNWPILNSQVSRNGAIIVVLSADPDGVSSNVCRVFDGQTGDCVAGPTSTPRSMTNIAIAPNGICLALFSKYQVQLWNTRSLKPVGFTLKLGRPISSVDLNPEGTEYLLASGKFVEIRKISRDSDRRWSFLHDQEVTHAEFDRLGSRIVSCCSDALFTKCYAQIWSTESGKPLGPRLYHDDGVLIAKFSPDGSVVATGSEDFTAAIWEVRTGKRKATLSHSDQVVSLDFNGAGSELLTQSRDGCLRLWDTERGAPLSPVIRNPSRGTEAQVLDDGTLMLQLTNGYSKVWSPSTLNSTNVLQLVRALIPTNGGARGGSLEESKQAVDYWRTMKDKHKNWFVSSPEDIVAWDMESADFCKSQNASAAETFHLQQAIAAAPNNEGIRERLGLLSANRKFPVKNN